MHRFFVAVLILLSAVLALVPAIAQDAEIVLDFYYPVQVGGSVADVMQRYADSFTEQFPNVRINVIYTGNYRQNEETIYTELQGGGSGPHVSIMGANHAYRLGDMGAIVPVQDFISAEGDVEAFLSQYVPAFLDYDPEGTLWSLPFQRSTIILYYNKDLFVAAGLNPEQPPRNREELVEYARALTTDDVWGLGMPTANGWMIQPFAIGAGDPIWSGDPLNVNFNAPGVVEAAEFMSALINDYRVQSPDMMSYGDVSQEFISGEIAMVLHSTGAMTNHIENAPFEVGVGFVPAAPAGEDGTGYVTVTGGANLFVFNRGSEAEQQAAWEWVKFLTSAESQAIWGVETGYIAANLGSWETTTLRDYLVERPQYGVALAQLEFAYPQMSAYVFDVNFIMDEALQRIIIEGVDAQEALDEAQRLADSLLAAYR